MLPELLYSATTRKKQKMFICYSETFSRDFWLRNQNASHLEPLEYTGSKCTAYVFLVREISDQLKNDSQKTDFMFIEQKTGMSIPNITEVTSAVTCCRLSQNYAALSFVGWCDWLAKHLILEREILYQILFDMKRDNERRLRYSLLVDTQLMHE